MARPSLSQTPAGVSLPLPMHESGLAPRNAHALSPGQELAERPHSRSRSEKPTELGEVRLSLIWRTQAAKSAGTRVGGTGRPSHEVSRAHICSTSSTTGGTTCPCWPRTTAGGGAARPAATEEGAPEGTTAGAPSASTSAPKRTPFRSAFHPAGALAIPAIPFF